MRISDPSEEGPMTSRKYLYIALVLLVLGLAPVAGRAIRAAEIAPEYGPAKGVLVNVGGGSTEGTTIMEKFIELGGGPNGRFVIIPTAGGNFEGAGADRRPRPYTE